MRKSVDLGIDRASVHSDSKVLPQEKKDSLIVDRTRIWSTLALDE